MTLTDDQGRRMRLWLEDEVKLDDPEKFMDMLVARIVGIMEKEPLDIYANATFLPRVIADKYDALWTEARMDKVIAAAVANHVAIEINARFCVPSAAFVARAKKAGAKFSLGTNNGDKDLGNLEYSLYVAKQVGLAKGDMFVPAKDGQKPIQRKGLPAAK
jgi:histidinol phosphatase-like PHP family hydrolase